MKINIKDLKEKIQLEILGSENWLQAIQSSFPHGSRDPLKGAIFISPLNSYGEATVSGKVQFTPLVNCSRCELPIGWPINENFSCRVREATESERDDSHVLVDDDVYELDESGSIDLENILNDVIQLAIPMRTVHSKKTADDKNQCLNCDEIWSETEEGQTAEVEVKKESPFAVLRGMKID